MRAPSKGGQGFQVCAPSKVGQIWVFVGRTSVLAGLRGGVGLNIVGESFVGQAFSGTGPHIPYSPEARRIVTSYVLRASLYVLCGGCGLHPINAFLTWPPSSTCAACARLPPPRRGRITHHAARLAVWSTVHMCVCQVLPQHVFRVILRAN